MEILLRSHTDGILQRNIKHNVFSNLKGKISLGTLCVAGLNIAESRFFLISDPLSLVVTFVVLEIYRTVVELYINKNFGQVNLLDLISIAT